MPALVYTQMSLILREPSKDGQVCDMYKSVHNYLTFRLVLPTLVIFVDVTNSEQSTAVKFLTQEPGRYL